MTCERFKVTVAPTQTMLPSGAFVPAYGLMVTVSMMEAAPFQERTVVGSSLQPPPSCALRFPIDSKTPASITCHTVFQAFFIL